MEAYRSVVLASKNLPTDGFGRQSVDEHQRSAKFEAKGYPGSRKSRLQQTLKRDCDYLKQITKQWRTGDSRPTSGTSTKHTRSITPNINSPYVIKRNKVALCTRTPQHTNISRNDFVNSYHSLETVNRPATNEIKRMHNLTRDYATRDFDLNMDIEEMRELVEEKKAMYWQLTKDINDATFHYQGIQDTNLSIEKFSESAYMSKKQQEKIKQGIFKTNEEANQLQQQKDNQQELIANENGDIKHLNKMFSHAKFQQRDIKKARDIRDRERIFLEKQNVAMEVRAKTACKYEEMLEGSCGVKKNLNTRLHKYLDM